MTTKAEEVAAGKRLEAVVASAAAAVYWPGCSAVGAHTFSDLDFAIIHPENGLVGFLEVKTRRVGADDYDSIIISERKHRAARCMRMHLKVKTLAVIYYRDNLGVFWLNEDPDGEGTISRRDREGGTVPHVYYMRERLEMHTEVFDQLKATYGVLE